MLFSRKMSVLFDISKTIRNKLTKYYVVDIFNKTKPLPLLFGHFDRLINYRYKMPNLVIDSLFSHPEMLIKPPIEKSIEVKRITRAAKGQFWTFNSTKGNETIITKTETMTPLAIPPKIHPPKMM